MTPRFGGEQVASDLDAALLRGRWVTLVGPPGSGKSLHARALADRRQPATWVDVTGLADAESVLRAALTALDASPAPGDEVTAAIGRHLDEQERLLVLDGVGPEVTGLGRSLVRILDSTVNSHILCTAVSIAGGPSEQVVRVEPLPVPGPGGPLSGPAVDLLRARVRSAGGRPIDLEADAPSVRRLLAATGGLPLLIEQLAVQIALVGLANVAVPRSLDQAIGTSYALLEPEHQTAFRRLSLIPVPAGLDVLATVCGDPADPHDTSRDRATEAVAALARRSLLRVRDDGRLDLLAPLRRHGELLTDATERAAVRDGLLRWADGVLPGDYNSGAADEPWLADFAVVRHTILTASADAETRRLAYDLANRAFGTLYTALLTHEAAGLLAAVVASGNGPPAIGCQVSRRAGIMASEAGGTYDGLPLLDRAEEQAAAAPDPDVERARNASIRAEMHLDAGDLDAARREALRALELGESDIAARSQANRTLADIHVCLGELDQAWEAADALARSAVGDESWLALAGRALLTQVALERGRPAEAAAAAKVLLEDSRASGEQRLALIAALLLRQADPMVAAEPVDVDSLPWSLRLSVLIQEARDLFRDGHPQQAAGRAADVVVLADGARLGHDGVHARLLLAHCLRVNGDDPQAVAMLIGALDRSVPAPLPLRTADALDGLAAAAIERDPQAARRFAATARAIRRRSRAVPWLLSGVLDAPVSPRSEPVPAGWLLGGRPTRALLADVEAWHADFTADEPSTHRPDHLEPLTAAERQVAERVAEGLTSREIAEELFVSPRTVDAHLSNIYRKLGIRTRSRLAALITKVST